MPENETRTPSPLTLRRRLPAPLAWTLLGILALAFLVFRHFLLTFTVAASVALLLAPLQRRAAQALGGRPGIPAALLVLLTALVILGPILGSASVLSGQAVTVFESVRPRLQPAALQEVWQHEIPARYPALKEYVDFESAELPEFVSAGLSQAVGTLNQLIQGTVARLTSTFLELLLFLMILFFLLRDGERLRDEVRGISPLSERQQSQILSHLTNTVKGVLLAMVVVPLVQGVVALVGFLIFGVPVPVLWSLMVVLAALIPLVGSPLGWIPACLYLLANGETWQWVGMSLYGVLLISTIDNLIKPMLLQGAASIHPLLGFLSILGGVLAFGPLGFLVGPVILSLVLSALRIYRLDILGQPDLSQAVAATPVPLPMEGGRESPAEEVREVAAEEGADVVR